MKDTEESLDKMVKICGYEFDAAGDEWDRLYGVDFFKKIGDSYVGIQIKPRTFDSSTVYGRYKGTVRNQHRQFSKRFGGRVFIVYNDSEGKTINTEICKEIEIEINRLMKIASR
jgi:hypothetical protein